VTLDKLDKVGPDGVVAELEANAAASDAVTALRTHLTRPQTLEFNPYGERQIRKALPDDFDSPAVADLLVLGESLAAALPADLPSGLPLVFDPFLVRGMGYYTGTIFEAAHPELGYSLGGGGRYDDMVGRF